MADVAFLKLPKEVWGLVCAWRRPTDQKIKIRFRFSRKGHDLWTSREDHRESIKGVIKSQILKSHLPKSIWVESGYGQYFHVDVVVEDEMDDMEVAAIATWWVKLRERMIQHVRTGKTSCTFNRNGRTYTYSPLSAIDNAAYELDKESLAQT